MAKKKVKSKPKPKPTNNNGIKTDVATTLGNDTVTPIENELPFVSICTPTFNRRPFIKTMFECFKNQDYPQHKMEWIIVDDGTDKIKDLIEESNIPQIRYFELDNKITLGAKRNYMHKHVKGSIVVYMDDDDYYPPERVSHSVDMLLKDEKALCAGGSEIYVYYKSMDKMMQCGPYGPNHATAGTFAFKTKLLEDTKYNDDAALAEEKAFLKDYTVPFVQLDPLKTILVFSHEHNTFDKREMFKTSHPDFFKESNKTVDSFIRQPREQSVKQFFMKDIDELLENYEPGLPKMKPDVLTQIAKIKIERAELIARETQKQLENGPIVIQQGDGKPPIQLNNLQVVNLVKKLQENNAELVAKNTQLQKQQEPIKLQQDDGKPPIPLTNIQVVTLMKKLQEDHNEVQRKHNELTDTYNNLQNTVSVMEMTILELKKQTNITS
jgi:glycosyltransferase involved in cell wall biosynthesis